ncbi:MAG TPA: transglycosylase SLT domain-containing protein [Pyrinomonadaceae bacterium]|nr:transglycosylase SLT domain-containing protein [Pyrinomonadaceae bacterium]
MKTGRIFISSLAVITCLTFYARVTTAQETAVTLYQQMAQSERAAFVGQQARRIASRISGADYEFTPEFEAEIQRFVDKYVRRMSNSGDSRLWKGDVRPAFERGVQIAPTLIGAFKARNVSPLIGLYIPLIESEYSNLPSPNSAGAIGMFQFLPKTGERYGLTEPDLLDVEKSADAAARYIADGLKQFKDDPMKETLAILAYNRGGQKTAQALKIVLNDQNKRCSICALTAARSRLDQTFQNENVYYVPSFFAAAIIGENPQAFGLQLQPLSSYEPSR